MMREPAIIVSDDDIADCALLLYYSGVLTLETSYDDGLQITYEESFPDLHYAPRALDVLRERIVALPRNSRRWFLQQVGDRLDKYYEDDRVEKDDEDEDGKEKVDSKDEDEGQGGPDR